MKILIHAFAMCQSMFCAIPCPWQIWDEKARGKMLLFLPIVGLEMGVLWALLAWGCSFLQLPALVWGIVLCAFPFAVTGFIHLDGYMDVTDAVKSWRDLERRREILKDSHVGSFSVIGVALLLLTQFAVLASMKDGADWRILALIPMVSRCCSALAVTALPPMNSSQYAGQKTNVVHIVVLTLQLFAAVAVGFWVCGKYGLALIGCLVGYGLALRRGYKSLQGMNGDIAGYALTIGELFAVAVLALI